MCWLWPKGAYAWLLLGVQWLVSEQKRFDVMVMMVVVEGVCFEASCVVWSRVVGLCVAY